jgi:hypothetical protein
MILWGVFDLREDDNDIHVVQTCSGGYVLAPHTLGYMCVCHPRFEKDGEGDLVVIHDDLTEGNPHGSQYSH